jgi:putative ABC transport system permease protein
MKAYFHTIVARLYGFLRSRSLDSGFNQELEEHLAMATAEKIRRGMTPEEARREARMELGGLTQLREAGRAAWGLPWLDTFALDIRLGLRMMRKSWGLTLIGGLAMAVAISVGATAFAFVEAFSGNTLPLDESDRLVRLVTHGRNRGFTSVQDFELWREEMRSVKDISAFWTIDRLLVTDDGSDGRVSVAAMTPSGFRVARVQPLAGRPLLEDDERAGATPVIVIGHDIWQSRFAGDRAVPGKTVQLGGVDHVVVGIMPEGFAFPLNHQVWIPFRANPVSEARPASANVVVFGRLTPGIAIDTAQAEIAVIGPASGDPRTNPEIRSRVAPYGESFRSTDIWWNVLPLLFVLLLVPPCANIAILIYARNVSRQEEFAARYVLGAGRGRIVGQLFIEAFVLAAAAGSVGLILAHQFLNVAQDVVDQIPSFAFWMKPNLSLETILYVAGLAAFAATVSGVLPALRATRRMRQSGFHGLGSRTTARLGITWTALVVMQVALSTAVLPTAGEMVWTQLNPNLVAREFAAEEYMMARIVLEDEPQIRDFQAELVRQVKAELGIPGATIAASTDGIDEAIRGIETDIAGQVPFTVASNHVDDAYFDVFKASLLAGRAFEAGDFNRSRPVAIVNRTFAEQLSQQNPLGKRLRYFGNDERWYEIVGVVDQISANTQRPSIYHPMLPGEIRRLSLTLHAGPTLPPGFARRLLGIARTVDPRIDIEEIRRLEDMYQQERREDNYMGSTMATIVLIVLLFSAAGIHTLVAFAVAQNRREIGIRSALGAPPLRLVADVFRRDLTPVVVGAGIGTLLSFPLDKLFPANHGFSHALSSACAAFLFMFAMGLFAVAGPARRALQVDSTEALRDS